jgi:hypothetical protein
VNTKRKIAILFHETDNRRQLGYIINGLAEIWRADGHEVIYLFGVSKFVPADLVIVHVDLSVVPDEYLEFAKRYPIVLNGAVKDIRKSAFSDLLVRPGDPYDGRVIVKSDLNYAGDRELAIQMLDGVRNLPAPLFRSPSDYRVFDHLRTVPPEWLTRSDIVVEKFVPEMEDSLYHVRMLLFLGDRMTCSRLASPDPIVKWSNQIRMEKVEPHPAIVQRLREMKFDCGKFDYVIHNGEAFLLDANKTTGSANVRLTPELMATRRYLAEGLYPYFEGAR